MDYGNTKIPSIHLRFGSVTVTAGFPQGRRPEFPMGEKSLTAWGNWTCVSSVLVRCCTNWATSPPLLLWQGVLPSKFSFSPHLAPFVPPNLLYEWSVVQVLNVKRGLYFLLVSWQLVFHPDINTQSVILTKQSSGPRKEDLTYTQISFTDRKSSNTSNRLSTNRNCKICHPLWLLHSL